MNKETVVLQVLTEFVASPEPQRQQTVDKTGRLVDSVLDFGDLRIGRGRAFIVGEDSEHSIAVNKCWSHPGGRTVLIEEVEYQSIEPLLSTLTASVSPSVKDSPDGVLHVVSAQRLLPPVKLAKKASQPMKMASAPLTDHGVLLDYAILSSTNTVLKGDVTYFVAGDRRHKQPCDRRRNNFEIYKYCFCQDHRHGHA